MKDAPMEDNDIHSAVNVQIAERIAGAPLPTRATLRMRQNLLIQSWRFVRINLKMMRIIFGGHS